MIKLEHCVYLKHIEEGFLILTLFVVDKLVASSDRKRLKKIKRWLVSQFDIKDMGKASYILGVKILWIHSRWTLGLSLMMYIRKILKSFKMSKEKPVDIAITKNHGFNLKYCPQTPIDRARMVAIPYTNSTESLMYAMMCTPSDLAYEVCLLNRYQSNPGVQH